MYTGIYFEGEKCCGEVIWFVHSREKGGLVIFIESQRNWIIPDFKAGHGQPLWCPLLCDGAIDGRTVPVYTTAFTNVNQNLVESVTLYRIIIVLLSISFSFH